MAINWLIALKAVPWSDLMQAAPHIVKGARRLFNTARSSDAAADASAELAGTGTVQERLQRIESALQTLDSEQEASAELIRSLAEQHARLVEAIEVLRARARILLGVNVALGIALAAATIWVLTR
jgi:hypothetical protein